MLKNPEPKPPKKNKGGRPELYTKALGQKVAHLISITSAGLKEICRRNPDIPAYDTIMTWSNKEKEFSDMYLEAKRMQINSHMEETYELIEGYKNEPMLSPEKINIIKEEISLRKWNAARLAPRIYGDRIKNETSVTIKSHEEWLKELE